MKLQFKYLTTSDEDLSWGIHLTVAGSATITPGTLYPPAQHPSEYSFSWEGGRVLHEYQLNYISKGGGIFENQYGKFQVKEGSLLVITSYSIHYTKLYDFLKQAETHGMSQRGGAVVSHLRISDTVIAADLIPKRNNFV